MAHGRVFVLRQNNPTSVSTVDGTNMTLNVDYILDGRRLILKDQVDTVADFPYLHTIVYTFGYATIPNDVKQAMYSVVTAMRNESKRQGGIAGFTQDKLSVTFETDRWGLKDPSTRDYITPEVKKMLKKYRVPYEMQATGRNIDTLQHTYPKI